MSVVSVNVSVMSVNVTLMSVFRLWYDTLSKNRKRGQPSGEKSLRGLFLCPKGSEAMPRKPKRPCRFSGCPKLTDSKSGYCEEHRSQMQRHYEHFSRGYKSKERYGSAWQKIRNRYIATHPLCEMCLGLGRATVATLVHHVKPLADGGTNDESNLKSLCVSCHERIHQRKKRRE